MAKMHWFIFLPGIIELILGGFLYALSAAAYEQGNSDLGAFFAVGAVVVLLLGALSLFRALIKKMSTELAVTTKRVIAKVGFVKRDTIELNHSKVESFNVDQSILGRIFGFGTIVINGTGGGKTPIPEIDSPLDFRRAAMGVIGPE